MIATELRTTFFSLVRLGIGHNADALPLNVDWNDLKALSESQGLSAVVLDGIERLTEKQRPPKVFLLEWIGETLQGYEYRYELYCRAIAEMAAFYNSHWYKMMLLKGYACALNWPKPEHRPCGDIDIWLFGRQAEADAALSSWFKDQGSSQEIDKSHHHHTVFYWRDFMVENHYDFVNVHAHRSSAEMEKEFKELGSEANLNYNENENSFGTRIPSIEVYGEKVYLPSPNLHALFLLKHAVSHFASANINLRQVLDWAFFVEKHTNEIDWDWLNGRLNYYHMKDFVKCLNAICVEKLGFNASIFHGVQFSPYLKDKVLNDIIYPAFVVEEPASLIPRIFYKYERWKGNAWKHDLCYKESRWCAFWSGVINHLLKPSSI